MPSVLVVDDEPAVRESLRMLLKKECDVETAESVDSALEQVRKSIPDLVLLDVGVVAVKAHGLRLRLTISFS